MVKFYFLIGALLLGGGSASGSVDYFLNTDDTVKASKVAYVAIDTNKDILAVGAKNSQKNADNLIPFPLWAVLKAADYPVDGVKPVPCPVWMLHHFEKFLTDKD